MINTGLDGENNYRKLSIKGRGGEEGYQKTGCPETVYMSIHSYFVIARWLLSIIPQWTRVQSPGSVKLEGILILQ